MENLLPEEPATLYRTLTENLPGIVYRVYIRENSRMQFFNEMLEELTGYRAEELVQGEVCSIDPLIHPEDRDRVIRKVNRAILKDIPFEIEYRLKHKNGSLRFMRERGRPVKGADGQPLFIDGVIFDTTEQKEVEEELRNSNEKLQTLIQASPLAIIALDTEGQVLSWNPAAESLLGWRESEVLGRPLPSVPEEGQEELRDLLRRGKTGERLMGAELWRRKRDGSTVLARLSNAPLRDREGNIHGFIGILEDVTAQKQAEKDLARRKAEFEAMFRTIKDVVAFADVQRRLVMVNPAVKAMFGYEPEELQGKSTELLYAQKADYEEQGRQRYQMGAKEDWSSYEVEYRRKDGSVFLAESSGAPVKDSQGNTLGFVSIHRDITERKQAEKALKEGEARLKLAHKAAHAGIWDWNIQTGELVWNEKSYELFGLSPESGRPSYEKWLQVLHPEDREACIAAVSQAIDHNKGIALEYRVVHPDGRVLWLNSTGETLCDDHGRAQSMTGITIDITSRKAAEKVLRNSHLELERRVQERTVELHRVNQRLREEIEVRRRAEEGLELERQRLFTLLEAIPSYVCLLTPDFTVAYANLEWRNRFGEPEGRRCYEILFGRQEPCVECQTSRVFETQTPLEWIGAGPDDRVYQIYDHPFVDIDGTPVVLEMGLDITEHKRAQEALQKSEARLAEAERIAHLGHWEWIIQSNEVIWSEEAYRIFQLLPHQVKASYETFLSRIHPEDIAMVEENVAEALAGRNLHSIDHRIILPEGSVRWVHEEGIVSFDETGKPVRMMGTVQDLTRLRQTEEALRDSEQRLRQLTSQLLNAQDRERKRISQELHDELGQSLQVLKLKIAAGMGKLRRDQSGLQNHCTELLTYLNGVIENVRRVSRDLSPAVLEDLGLSSAIRFLLDELCKHYKIKEFAHEIEEIGQCFSPQAQLDLYRIFQESLNNIGKHAQASRVAVSIKRRGKQVSFRVEDNGQGFDAEKLFNLGATEKGLGLAAIEERVRRLGGKLEIRSRKGKGTRIAFQLPVEMEDGS